MEMRKIVRYEAATKGWIAVLECGHTRHLTEQSSTSRARCWECDRGTTVEQALSHHEEDVYGNMEDPHPPRPR